MHACHVLGTVFAGGQPPRMGGRFPGGRGSEAWGAVCLLLSHGGWGTRLGNTARPVSSTSVERPFVTWYFSGHTRHPQKQPERQQGAHYPCISGEPEGATRSTVRSPFGRCPRHRRAGMGQSPEAPGFSAEHPLAPEGGSFAGTRARATGVPGESTCCQTTCGWRSGRGAAGGAGRGPRRRGTGRKAGAPGREGGDVGPCPGNLSRVSLPEGRRPSPRLPGKGAALPGATPPAPGVCPVLKLCPAQAQRTFGRSPIMQASA